MSYRRYILPLLPTFDTVKGLPPLPAAPPSAGASYLESPSLLALRSMLFSLRNPSCKGFFREESRRPTTPLDLGAVASAGFLSGDAPISRAAATGRLELAKPRRGDSRSRCRCRRLSGERARGLGAASMVVGVPGESHVEYAVAVFCLLRCIGRGPGCWCALMVLKAWSGQEWDEEDGRRRRADLSGTHRNGRPRGGEIH